MTYLLDTNIVSYFLQAQREKDLAAAAKRCSMAVVEEVLRELRDDPKRGGRAFERWFDASGIEVRAIQLGSEAHVVFQSLLSQSASNKDLGERASIALASEDASLTFVSNDKNALLIALRELFAPGERALGVSVFLRRLFEARCMDDPRALDAVMRHTTIPEPTWWATWYAGLAAPLAPQPDADDHAAT